MRGTSNYSGRGHTGTGTVPPLVVTLLQYEPDLSSIAYMHMTCRCHWTTATYCFKLKWGCRGSVAVIMSWIILCVLWWHELHLHACAHALGELPWSTPLSSVLKPRSASNLCIVYLRSHWPNKLHFRVKAARLAGVTASLDDQIGYKLTVYKPAFDNFQISQYKNEWDYHGKVINFNCWVKHVKHLFS